jgi:hypothetical protein
VLEQLGRADAAITSLADKFHMTLTGMKKLFEARFDASDNIILEMEQEEEDGPANE